MSQHDFDIANADGATVRADINAAFQAAVELSSGATAPSTTFAFMWWADTSAGILKRRNSANTAWISIMSLTTGLIIGTDVAAYNADALFADVADVLTAGFAATPYNAGTKSTGTYTPDEANGNFQYAVNGGAHTLAPPTNNCTMVIQYTNNGSAGAITTSGFTKVDGSFTTTNGDDFFAYITKHNGFSLLQIVALQ